MKVWIVSLEYNDRAPSEVTGETGILGVFVNEADARALQAAEQAELHEDYQIVYQYSHEPGRYCIACGEEAAGHVCKNAFPEDAEEFCDLCGAEFGNNNTCDNDHDEWDIDVHCTEFEVCPAK